MEQKAIRCAVYTRKSSEEGLEQEFNSLDAQREAGEAFVLSQRHEGWVLLPDRYDDGGISGGTMERPGLQQLLADVRGGLIDVVVVYKVDRLSRALGDFAQIIDLFDKHGVSFVSVTQQFNTTSSMGRLTLNILLSFAQFEREVTGERIRDKIALSKQRGLWMGGPVPLGYDVLERKLVPSETEGPLVRRIFTRFVQLGSTTLLSRELNAQGYRTKPRRGRDGQVHHGHPFNKTMLYKVLHNRLYLGEIRHKDRWYPGEHAAIVEPALWEQAHALLAQDRHQRAGVVRRKTPAPLKGLLFGPDGKAMTPTHTRKGDRQYRYYITHTANKLGHDHCPVRLVPAGDIEGLVVDQIKALLRNPTLLAETGRSAQRLDRELTASDIRETLQSLDAVWEHLYFQEQARLLQLFVERIQIETDGVHIAFRTLGIHSLVMDLKTHAHPPQEQAA